MIIGISGIATDRDGNKGTTGVGKDLVADHLVEKHSAVKVAMADPLKRIARDVYAFTEEQLWGPSEYRNEPDRRYPRPRHDWRYDESVQRRECACCNLRTHYDDYDADVTTCFLTPRYALQLLGTEWGRHCYPDTWVDLALRTATQILEGSFAYDPHLGIFERDFYSIRDFHRTEFVGIPDIRFINELKAVRASGGKLVRIKRDVEKTFASSAKHVSETQLLDLPDEEFDEIIENDSDTHTLGLKVDRMVDVFSGRIRPYRDGQDDVPPFKRG